MSVRLSGRKLIDSDEAGRHVELAHTWRDGDVLDVDLPMHAHLAPLPHAPTRKDDLRRQDLGPTLTTGPTP
jgi:DUF1680 family protein